jgi:biopolymer transport protein ExbD
MANVATVTAPVRLQVPRARHATSVHASMMPVAIIANKKIGPGAKLVYSKLLAYAAANEVATNNRLAADLAVSPRSVRNYISALKSVGLVKVRLQPGKPSSYTLTSSL